MINMSLRRRIAIWYGLAITALVFIMAFAAQQVLVLNMRGDIDESLEERAQTVIATVRASIAASGEDNYLDLSIAIQQFTRQEFPSIPLFLRIGLPDGEVITAFGDIPDPIIPTLDREIQLSGDDSGRYETVAIQGIEALRVYTVSIRDLADTRNLGVIQTAESLSQIASAQNQLWRLTVLIGVVGSLMALAVGLLILSRGFRPLDRILMHVHNIEGSNLQIELPEEARPPELQELADSLNSMWKRLDSAFRAKQMFVASVSHELRTPLTAIAGQIEVLLMQPSLETETADSLHRMSREVRRLVTMTNSLLLNAELEANPSIGHEDIRLGELLEECIGEVWVLAQDIDLGLSVAEEVIARGDHDLVKQMVLNLLDNAIKYTPFNGRVDLSLQRDEDWAIIEVSDTGQGIPEDHLPNIMEAFYKADRSRGTRGQGAGLGLAIVKQIVDLHRGEIEIRSRQGKGTQVKLRLPVSPSAGAQITSDIPKLTSVSPGG